MSGIPSAPATLDYDPVTRPSRVAKLLKELVEEVGLHDGSTVGSLVARIAAVEGGTTGLQLEGLSGTDTTAIADTAAPGASTKAARADHAHTADGAHVALTGLTSGDWATSAPTTTKAAINRISALLKTLNTNTAIP